MAEARLFFCLFFLIKVTPSGFSDVVSGEPVQATVVDDVILPCYLHPPFDVNNLTVEWTLNGSYVHIYRHKIDNPSDLQDKHFRNRTSLFHHELTKGNISLKLTNVTEEDSGLYICYVPKLDSQVKKGNVLLTVNPQKDPAGRGFSGVIGHDVQATAGDNVILLCHLKPQSDVTSLTVQWKRDDHNVHLHGGRAHDHNLQDERFRGRTTMFHDEMKNGNISLKLTNVREDDSGLYICYVPELERPVKEGNVLLTVRGDLLDTRIIIISALSGFVFIAVSAVMFFYIRRRRNKQDNDRRRGQRDAEVEIPLGPVPE